MCWKHVSFFVVCVCFYCCRCVKQAALLVAPLPDCFSSQRQYDRHPRIGDDQYSESRRSLSTSNAPNALSSITDISTLAYSENKFPCLPSTSLYIFHVTQHSPVRPFLVRWLVYFVRFEKTKIPVPRSWSCGIRFQYRVPGSKLFRFPSCRIPWHRRRQGTSRTCQFVDHLTRSK